MKTHQLERCRRTQDTSQDDSPSSRSPEDVPSKSYGPMDITTTSTDWQWEFQRKLEFQSQRHSVRMLSPRGRNQAKGRDNPVTSSAKPIVNSKCQVNSSQANWYHEANCASRNPEVVVTSVNVNQRADDHGTRWRTPSKEISFSQREGSTPSTSEPRHQTLKNVEPSQSRKSVQDATTLIRATTSKESEVVRIVQSTASEEDS
ncbi:unnamed protein product [Caenorhabditis nigoni]